MKKIVCVSALTAAALRLVAGEVTWSSTPENYTDWTNGKNFVGEQAPVAGEIVLADGGRHPVALPSLGIAWLER